MRVHKLRWRLAPGVSSSDAQALKDALNRQTLIPVEGIRKRRLGTRAFWILPLSEQLGCDIFVKEYKDISFTRRLRGLLGRSPADREFDNLVRLRELGVGVPRPLARVDDGRGLGCRASFLLMQRLADAHTVMEEFRRLEAPGQKGFEGETFLDALARFVLGMFAKGVAYWNLFPYNILVQMDGSSGAYRFSIVDVGAAEFRQEPASELVESQLAFLAGALMRDGVSESGIRRFLETVRRVDGGGFIGCDTEALFAKARVCMETLQARDERKRQERALKAEADRSAAEAFGKKYSSAESAEHYRDKRFARPYGRKVSAAEQRLVDRLIGQLGVSKSVLDVPCGAGRFLHIFLKRNLAVTAADISPAMLEVAQKEHPEKKCRFVTADARALPFADGRFELAFAMRLFHRISGPDERLAILRELARVSNRWVLFSFYNSRSLRGLRDWLRGRYPGQTHGSIRSEAEQVGLKVVQFYPLWLGARQTLVVCAK